MLLDADAQRALVIEVKLNWKDGRDQKLIEEYLPLVRSAFGVATFPLLITANVRGLQHKPMTSFTELVACYDWRPGDPTPVLLLPKP